MNASLIPGGEPVMTKSKKRNARRKKSKEQDRCSDQIDEEMKKCANAALMKRCDLRVDDGRDWNFSKWSCRSDFECQNDASCAHSVQVDFAHTLTDGGILVYYLDGERLFCNYV